MPLSRVSFKPILSKLFMHFTSSLVSNSTLLRSSSIRSSRPNVLLDVDAILMSRIELNQGTASGIRLLNLMLFIWNYSKFWFSKMIVFTHLNAPWWSVRVPRWSASISNFRTWKKLFGGRSISKSLRTKEFTNEPTSFW